MSLRLLDFPQFYEHFGAINGGIQYLVGGLEHQFYFPRNIGFLIIPIDEIIFFRGVQSTNQNQPTLKISLVCRCANSLRWIIPICPSYSKEGLLETEASYMSWLLEGPLRRAVGGPVATVVPCNFLTGDHLPMVPVGGWCDQRWGRWPEIFGTRWSNFLGQKNT